jgi:hypothetical protein
LGWGEDDTIARAQTLLETGKIDAILRQKPEDYAKRRPKITDLFEEAPEVIGNSMFWNTLYSLEAAVGTRSNGVCGGPAPENWRPESPRY